MRTAFLRCCSQDCRKFPCFMYRYFKFEFICIRNFLNYNYCLPVYFFPFKSCIFYHQLRTYQLNRLFDRFMYSLYAQILFTLLVASWYLLKNCLPNEWCTYSFLFLWYFNCVQERKVSVQILENRCTTRVLSSIKL